MNLVKNPPLLSYHLERRRETYVFYRIYFVMYILTNYERSYMSHKTIGSIVSELSQQTPDSLDPIEIQRATEREYLNELVKIYITK